MIHELSFLTNDGWVVTLISDKQISLCGGTVESIIVQPVEDYRQRLLDNPEGDGLARREVGLHRREDL